MKLTQQLSTTATISACLITMHHQVERINAQATMININDIDTNDRSLSDNSRRSLYTPQQCNSWITTALTTANGNDGLSQSDYLTFLKSISPPYVSQYFASFPSFAELPYDARISNKILSCSCASLPGYDKDTCCSGDDVKMPLAGFRSGSTAAAYDAASDNTSTNNNNEEEEDVIAISKEELDYRIYFCEILGNLVSRVPIVPTTNPTLTISSSPSVTRSSSAPSQSPPTPDNASSNEPDALVDKKGLSTGAMIGIILAILVAILVAILMRQLRNKDAAGSGDEGNNTEEVEGAADRKDDASSDPSVWSESEERNNNNSVNEDDTNYNEDGDVEEQREGSAVAAIGVASTVVAQISSSPKRNNDDDDV